MRGIYGWWTNEKDPLFIEESFFYMHMFNIIKALTTWYIWAPCISKRLTPNNLRNKAKPQKLTSSKCLIKTGDWFGALRWLLRCLESGCLYSTCTKGKFFFWMHHAKSLTKNNLIVSPWAWAWNKSHDISSTVHFHYRSKHFSDASVKYTRLATKQIFIRYLAPGNSLFIRLIFPVQLPCSCVCARLKEQTRQVIHLDELKHNW